MLIFILAAAVLFLAYANGANDNFKGVASLFGSGTTQYKRAVLWAAVTTGAGSIAAVFVSAELLKKFSGKGVVPDALTTQPLFLLAVALGAGCTVILATRFGFPISTTHGLTGALVGAGSVAGGSGVHYGKLWDGFAKPLLLSPLLALGLGALVYLILRLVRLAPDHRTRTLDAMHLLSAGAVGFARGMNDTPKIAALLAAVAALSGDLVLGLVAVAMVLGGCLSAKRVADTMAHKITAMNPGQGFAANLATALLVTTATFHGLPVSTTHVSVGGLLGIGIATRQAKWQTVIPVLLSWIITLPCAALVGAIVYKIGGSLTS
ncbi:MAG: anion permease [Verrucomicrobiales bacterium]|nr:anion permease [Verrucomicrobiales bacterium]MCP5558664.1 inorganic phosphate transporter [Verrucomicrobiaceae bacterium]